MATKLEEIFAGHRVFSPPKNSSGRDLQSLASGSIAIYGIGECAHWFHEIGMKRMGLKPIIALDQNPKTPEWWGVKTSTAKDFLSTSSCSNINIPVIVCVGSRKVFNIIRESLLKLGLLNVYYLFQ